LLKKRETPAWWLQGDGKEKKRNQKRKKKRIRKRDRILEEKGRKRGTSGETTKNNLIFIQYQQRGRGSNDWSSIKD